ncbi:MAG TPA: uroporphyrinogen decarboxylase [Verrucomicrobiae bacterium]|nr:uroporphyrinogen decarboxylase [Verrucomicrobiae bacterium]
MNTTTETTVTAPTTNRERFLAAANCRAVDRPPVWLMRQAGRALPEYRKLKADHDFLKLVRTPELAAEVTLQPVRRFDFDGAILFSDILVVAEGLGQGYRFRDGGGIAMNFRLENAADIKKLDATAIPEKLNYIPQALRLIKNELAGKTALLGFAGSPWTIANFMLEGGSAKEFVQAKNLFHTQPEVFSLLMEKLTVAVTRLLQMQIMAGAEVVQIFDSLGGLLSQGEFAEASAKWIRRIVSELNSAVPVIVFAKDIHGNWNDLIATGANILGIDSGLRLADVRKLLPPEIAVQGNLDPFLLLTTPDKVAAETNRILTEMRGARGHIFNLGHGVPPDAKLENIAALVETVKKFK